jgi:hypothetical protein
VTLLAIGARLSGRATIPLPTRRPKRGAPTSGALVRATQPTSIPAPRPPVVGERSRRETEPGTHRHADTDAHTAAEKHADGHAYSGTQPDPKPTPIPHRRSAFVH